ncbi:MAG TPA: Dabb family protein [Armatimonadota bacterium]|jgi:hypothetical protein
MIEHVVLFKPKPEATAEQREAMIKGLLALRGKIDGIVDAVAGTNICPRGGGYEIGFVVRLTDKTALEAYGPHPAHQRFIREHWEPIQGEVLAVDFEHVAP